MFDWFKRKKTPGVSYSGAGAKPRKPRKLVREGTHPDNNKDKGLQPRSKNGQFAPKKNGRRK